MYCVKTKTNKNYSKKIFETPFYLHFCEVVRKNARKPHWVISPPIQCLRQARHYNCQQGRAHGGGDDDFGGGDLRPNAINLKGLQCWAQ